MFLSKKKMNSAELPLEKVRFSPKDLFTLMGGFDAGMVACNTHNIDEDKVLKEHAHRDAWRRNLVNRYHAAGWVDAEGNPNEELGRAVRCLASEGVLVMDGNYEKGTAEVVIADGHACGLVKGEGFRAGYFLKPFPDDTNLWEDKFREVFPAESHPLEKADRDLHVAVAAYDGGPVPLSDMLCNRDYEGLRAYAERHGIPGDVLGSVANGLPRSYYMAVIDTRGCKFDHIGDVGNPMGPRGVAFRAKRLRVLPELGMSMSGCNSGRPGFPDDWAKHVREEEYKRTSHFWAIDASSRGSLLELCSRLDDYPVQDVVDLAPAPGFSGILG